MSEIEQMYMELGESWENDPGSYVKAMKGNRALFVQSLTDLDAAEMVKTWNDETLFDVEISGSDLGLNKETRKKVNDAAKAERAARSSAPTPTGHGMNDEGSQTTE